MKKVFWKEVPEIGGTEFRRRLERSLDENRSDYFETYCESLDCWLEVRAFPSAHGMAVCFRDVTEQRKTEQQLLRVQRMDSIGTLAGGIAHDLNNVFAPLMMSVGLLQNGETDPTRINILSTMEASVNRGAEMVRQLLVFGRGTDSRRTKVAVPDLLRTIEKVANDIFLKTIIVRAVIPLGIRSVSGDATQLHQVFLNLAVNARDAMPEGGTLTLSVENIRLERGDFRLGGRCGPGAYVLVGVEDTGSGMSPAVQDRIFEPFFTTKPLGKGTGLGLSTSLGIVHGHGGILRVDSHEGKGTRFEVYLPAESDSWEEETGPAEASLPAGNGESILVVDDEPGVRELVRTTLETFGYRVILAGGGDEAIHFFRRHRDDITVVLTDLMMPGMAGAELIERLREIDPEVTIIASSGVAVDTASGNPATPRADFFLAKPYSTEAILKAMMNATTRTNEKTPPGGLHSSDGEGLPGD